MNPLSKVYIFKISATLLVWCIPLVLLPASWLEATGLPVQSHLMFLRMLGWAYFALCIGYAFGLKDALAGVLTRGPIWMGIFSNGGACLFLLTHGVQGAWSEWGPWIRFVLWASCLATGWITTGLVVFGLFGKRAPHHS